MFTTTTRNTCGSSGQSQCKLPRPTHLHYSTSIYRQLRLSSLKHLSTLPLNFQTIHVFGTNCHLRDFGCCARRFSTIRGTWPFRTSWRQHLLPSCMSFARNYCQQFTTRQRKMGIQILENGPLKKLLNWTNGKPTRWLRHKTIPSPSKPLPSLPMHILRLMDGIILTNPMIFRTTMMIMMMMTTWSR